MSPIENAMARKLEFERRCRIRYLRGVMADSLVLSRDMEEAALHEAAGFLELARELKRGARQCAMWQEKIAEAQRGETRAERRAERSAER